MKLRGNETRKNSQPLSKKHRSGVLEFDGPEEGGINLSNAPGHSDERCNLFVTFGEVLKQVKILPS